MWEDERKKTRICNILISLVLVMALLGLAAAMISVSQRIAQEDARLNAVHSSQREELNEARQENLAAAQVAYEKHLETLGTYLPGIVCWGDSLTTGSSGNVSYPLTLQKYIDTYLCEIYDLRYCVKNPEQYARLDWERYKVSIPVVNMGSGQENAATVLGRSGVAPYVVSSDFVIPAGQERVQVSIVSQDGKAVTPLTAGDAGINPVTLAGVEGTLVRTAGSYGTRASYQFTRLEPGEEITVEKGTQVKTAGKDMYRDYIHIVWLGTYGEFTTPEALVNEVKALLERQTANRDRYLVIGPCTYRGSWALASAYSLDAIDSAMLQAFGNRYINFRKYLLEDGLRDAKLTATRADTESIGRGMVPESFRSRAGGADLNGAAYPLLGRLVYERMELLGYFEEVREALNLDKITQDILKEDADYFEKRLK